MLHKKIIRVAIVVGCLLLIPLVLTLLGSGVDGDGFHWTFADFAFAFVLLFGAGVAYELLARRTGTTKSLIMIGFAIALIVGAIWTELAVGAISQLVHFLL